MFFKTRITLDNALKQLTVDDLNNALKVCQTSSIIGDSEDRERITFSGLFNLGKGEQQTFVSVCEDLSNTVDVGQNLEENLELVDLKEEFAVALWAIESVLGKKSRFKEIEKFDSVSLRLDDRIFSPRHVFLNMKTAAVKQTFSIEIDLPELIAVINNPTQRLAIPAIPPPEVKTGSKVTCYTILLAVIIVLWLTMMFNPQPKKLQ